MREVLERFDFDNTISKLDKAGLLFQVLERIDTTKGDVKNGEVGVVGYEINFNRYFYRYTPPRPPEEIDADIRAIEGDIVRMLAEITGSAS
jgi:hypothetical protein